MFEWNRRNAIKCGVVVLYLVGVALLFSGAFSGSPTFHVPESFLQSEANSHLPKTFHGITVTEATLHLDNAIDILTEMEGHKLGKKFTMVVHAVGQPDYEHSRNGELYFRPQKVEIIDFSYTGAPPGQLLGKIRDRYVTNAGMKNLLTDVAPRLEDWMKAAAEKTAVVALQHIPVYKVKGMYLGGAVTHVAIEGNQLAVTFSLWMVTALVLISGVLLFLAIVGTAGLFLA